MKSCFTNKKPIVVMYYTYPNKVGGPLTYINTLINSPLNQSYEFKTIFQNKAPGGFDLALLRRMVKEIKKIRPDIVHVHGAQSEGFYGIIASKLAGCKHIVMTVHGFAFDDSGCRGIKKFLYKHIVEPFSVHVADYVYCVCEYAAKRPIVTKHARKRKICYIHNPVSLDVPTISRKDMREQLQCLDTDIVFCISGRVTKDKGFQILEEIVKRINKENIKNFKLLVIGDGDYFSEFSKNMSREINNNQVIMVGQTNQVVNYLNASDAFLFPTYHENLSIALLEANAAGLACVVSDVGGNREIVEDGRNGFLLKEITSDAFFEKICVLINDNVTLKNMSENAKSIAEEKFGLSTICDKINEVYKECLQI